MSDLQIKDKVQNVYDAENDTFVEITPEQKRYANYVYDQFKLSVLLNAATLKKILEEKLYLALGYESRDDFILNGAKYSRSYAYELIAIAKAFEPYIAEYIDNKQLTEDASSNTLVQTSGLLDMGISKLYELAKLEKKDLKTLIETGEIGEGEDKTTLDEIKDMAVREASLKLKKYTASYKAKINKLTEVNQTLKEELKLKESENAALQEKIKDAAELEKRFGAVASTLEHKKSLLNDADDYLDKLEVTMHKANVTLDDLPKIRDRYEALLKGIDELHEKLIKNYGVIKKEDN